MSFFDPQNEEEERLRNFVIYKMPLSDKEIEDMAPIYLVVFGVILAIILVIVFCAKKAS